MLLAKNTYPEVLQAPSSQPRIKALHLNGHVSDVREPKSRATSTSTSHRKMPSLANILAVSPGPDENREHVSPRSPSFDKNRTLSPPISTGSPFDAKRSSPRPPPRHVAKLAPNRSHKLQSHARKASLDSLMTAVEAVETGRQIPNQRLPSYSSQHLLEWKARINNIFSLTTDIVRSLESWPTFSSSYGPNEYPLDRLSFHQVRDVVENSQQLVSETRAVLKLKRVRDDEACLARADTVNHAGPANYTYRPQHHASSLPGFDAMQLGSSQPQNAGMPKALAGTTIPSPADTRGTVLVKGAFTYPPTSGAGVKNNPVARSVDQTVNLNQAGTLNAADTTASIAKTIESPVHDEVRNERPSYAVQGMECVHCASTETPEWRRGPYGNRTVCNACGLFYCKIVKRFGVQKANLLMRYRRYTLPEDRRVPSRLVVPEYFVQKLEADKSLDHNFSAL
ncbi:Gat2p LALA0_S02e04632g [Lachancea lanzarotensis]|uniref:LALA0S02e04632g1_1 n=1 Tax=Lachancea lanzarotensis TaxID=1245769 RepID=A0A0C7N6K3_9SACH|nr:uncharacterized protein LALA0_S02e04632g [Lachancea lanzarotensis]CEP61006.1 LALA0S02e04632g1_1 [Lachancea lanzarotensis]